MKTVYMIIICPSKNVIKFIVGAHKDVYLISGKTFKFHFLRSNGILWVSSNMVYMKNPAA